MTKKMGIKFFTFSICLAMCLTGCASVKFFEGPGDETDKEVGFPFYPPKPYILIERGEKGLVTSLISLPDTSNPHYVKTSTGLGTAEMGFDVQNAMISKFNSSTDSKIPETITALTTIATGSAALITAESMKLTAEKLKDESIKTLEKMQPKTKDTKVDYTLKEYVDAETMLKCTIRPLLTGTASDDECADTIKPKTSEEQKKLATLFGEELIIVNDQIQILESNKNISYELDKPDTLIEKLKASVNTTRSIVTELTYVSDRLATYHNNPGDFKEEFKYAKKIHEILKPVISSLSSLLANGSDKEGLYEINYLKGSLVLRKIDPVNK